MIGPGGPPTCTQVHRARWPRLPWPGLVFSGSCLLAGCLTGWYAWLSIFPDARGIGPELAAGGRLEDEGRFGEAAALYERAARADTKGTIAAAERLRALGAPERLASMPASHAASVIDSLADRAEVTGELGASAGQLGQQAVLLARAAGERAPADALGLLRVATRLVDDKEPIRALRQELCERALEAAPGDLALLTELAAVHGARGDVGRCVSLLEPHAARVGSGEAARLLGRALMRTGRVDEAVPLLQAYVAPRLPGLWRDSVLRRSERDRLALQLPTRLARRYTDEFDYGRYHQADGLERERLVASYLQARLSRDEAVVAPLRRLRAGALVIDAALDLVSASLENASVGPAGAATATRALETALEVEAVGARVDLDKLASCAERLSQAHLDGAVACLWRARLASTFRELLTRCPRLAPELWSFRAVGGAGSALCLALHLGADASSTLRESPGLRRALAARRARLRAVPDEACASDWVLLRPVEPAGADEVRQVLLASAKGRRLAELRRQLTPADGDAAVERFCWYLLDGQAGAALGCLDASRVLGLPIPRVVVPVTAPATDRPRARRAR